MAHRVTPRSSGHAGPEQRVGPVPPAPPAVTLGGTRLGLVGSARIYVCGITPYDVTHLGHASTFVWADLLASVVESTGVRSLVCRNVTDVDDVLHDAARSRGRYFDEFAVVQQATFDRSMSALRVARPTAEPRARHHVEAVQQLAQALLAAGAAYERDGWVRFRGEHVPGTVGLAEDRARELSAAYDDRPDDPAKDHPFDVVVWQPSGPEDPAWPSPWGWGRPGWHVECAAMALAVQGAGVDVLVGGDDLAFPHHAYVAAMVTAATGVMPFARARLHVGTVGLDGARMAKSTGNLVLVDDVLAECEPAALRLLLLDRRYAEPWDYHVEEIAGAQERLELLYAAAAKTGSAPGAEERVMARLRDDLDVPGALAVADAEGGEAARRAISALRLG